MKDGTLFPAVTQLLVLLFAISLHEAAHAWAALRCGDPGPRELGRTTLNPLHHIDPVGSLLVPVMLLIGGLPLFGWGRTTVWQVDRLRRQQRDDVLVHAAGPAANLAAFLLAAVALAITLQEVPEARAAAAAALEPPFGKAESAAHFPLMFTLVQLAFLNAFLALLNLLPVPPLDGGQILLRIMPEEWATRMAGVRPFGLTIVLALALVQALALLVMPVTLILSRVIAW
jgi:Zn-dependent protease